MQQDELARQFLRHSSNAMAEQYQHDVPVNAEDADAAAEAELARQFAQTQQQRYSGEQPAGANPFPLDDFEFSPMKALLDDGPHEPLFTPIVEPVQQPQQLVAPQQQYQQPQQPVPPQQQYRSRNNWLHRSSSIKQPRNNRLRHSSNISSRNSRLRRSRAISSHNSSRSRRSHNISSRNNRLRHSRNISSRNKPVAPQPQYQQPQQLVAPQQQDTPLPSAVDA